MRLIDKFFFRNYNLLKITIIGSVIFLVSITNFVSYFYFNKSLNNIILDIIFTIILFYLFIHFTFYLVRKKENQLNSQIEQLTDAYQYIGQINRKIDALLELDIASLDHSAKRPVHETASTIFKQLMSLVNAKAGFLYLNPPFEFRILINGNKNIEIKNFLEILARSKVKEFRHSQGQENEKFFKELGLPLELLKKFDFIIKPIYMHQQDIGVMFLVFKKNQPLEDRDFNIIRVFSFYLALNATFKPDFSIYQT